MNKLDMNVNLLETDEMTNINGGHTPCDSAYSLGHDIGEALCDAWDTICGWFD